MYTAKDKQLIPCGYCTEEKERKSLNVVAPRKYSKRDSILESALLGDQYREESVRTITFTHLYVLKRDEFESLLKVMTNHDHNRNGNSGSVPHSSHLSPPRMSSKPII